MLRCLSLYPAHEVRSLSTKSPVRWGVRLKPDLLVAECAGFQLEERQAKA
jgi:hypothetical protein